MSDITERLREIRDRDCYDAAAEIERLRAELDAKQDELQKWIAKASEDWPEALDKIERLTAEFASEREAHETLCAEYERLSDCYADLIADIDARSCASVYFERALHAAPDAFVLAVHDLTHAIMSDRARGGVNPNPRRMKDAVKIIRDEIRKRGHQDEWNKLRDA